MSLSNQFIIGQYIDKNSIIHRLDPRTKLIIVFIFMLSTMFLTNLISYALPVLLVSSTIFVSQIPSSYIVKGLKPVWLIVIATSIFHIFLTQGNHLLIRVGSIFIYEEGVIKAITITLRIILLLVTASLLTLTTKLTDLTNGIETLLAPLKKIGVPTQEIAMMISLTIRFIPILMHETEKIMKAQRARGVNFSSGNFIKRILNFIPIIVPILMLSFQKAESVSLAVEARGYRPGMERTQLRILTLQGIDYKALLISAFCFAVIIAFRM
ncbi:MAG: energy-coupling factor transporter transmembrane component T [Paenibacillaceae bacterium]